MPGRLQVMVVSLIAGVLFVALLSLALSGRAAVLVLDHPSSHFPYPFTIQNFMHILFFIGLGELFVRWRVAREENHLREQLCPRMTHGPARRAISARYASASRARSTSEHGVLAVAHRPVHLAVPVRPLAWTRPWRVMNNAARADRAPRGHALRH